jgi:hypothetical protein
MLHCVGGTEVLEVGVMEGQRNMAEAEKKGSKKRGKSRRGVP